MSFNLIGWPLILVISVATLAILISHDWRIRISALGIAYAGSFGLVAFSWPPEMAVVKLVAGWISASVLGLAITSQPKADRVSSRLFPSEIIFRLSISGLMSLVIISLAPTIQLWLIEATLEQVVGGMLLFGLGLLSLGLVSEILPTIIGLLLCLMGFEILYASIESSVLVAGFLAVTNLGLALTGAYLLTVSQMEVEG